MITNEQVEAALKAWYDAGDAGNFASMFAALKAAELTSHARIEKLEAALKQMLELADEEFLWDYPQVYAARAALEKKND